MRGTDCDSEGVNTRLGNELFNLFGLGVGFLAVLNMWWMGEGCTLTVEELTKKFKAMLTYCEKMANDKTDPQFIDNPYVRYEDEVKAK